MSCHNYLAYPFEKYAESEVRFNYLPRVKDSYFKVEGLYLNHPSHKWERFDHISDGHGGTEVYKVRDILSEEISALKIIPKSAVKKRYRRDMIKMEVGSQMDIASYSLKDPVGASYLCQMKSFWETDDLVLILMEYCSGNTMGDESWEYKNNAMDESHAKIIMKKLVIGLQTLWKVGYCHRDIKASNMIVRQVYGKNGAVDYDVKWIDFGFAWPVDRLSTNFPGTTPYKSPELI